jgi:hypothetical protein
MGQHYGSAARLMREIWRKAWREGELRVKFAEPGAASRARFGLYNAVKRERRGQGEDWELIRAVDVVEVVWGNAERTELVLQRRDRSAVIRGLEAALGVGMEQVMTPEELEVERRLAELGREVEGRRGGGTETSPSAPAPQPSAPAPAIPDLPPAIPDFARAANPYYTKDD